MKMLTLLTVSFSVVATALSFGEDKTVSNNQVSVTYVSPEKFTDFTTSGFGTATDKDLKYLTETFASYIEDLAKRHLAPGERLEVIFKDIDLAGRFEPEHGPRTQDVRIYRDITFPRMNLSFKLLDQNGQVLAEGDRKLTDMSYNRNILPPTGDTEFRYDKALLSDWMSKEFRKKKN